MALLFCEGAAMDVEDRRAAFVRDIIEVCKKHRVMIEPDGSDLCESEALDVLFSEHNADHGLNFYVELTGLEEVIRAEVWSVVHGDTK
jgi:hypothetical protein